MKPLLRAGPLTGKIYCLTRYRVRADGTIMAITKHDVTDEFMALMEVVQADDWKFEYVEEPEDQKQETFS